MFALDNSPGRTATVNGKEYLFFSGYSYLAMGQVEQFVELIKEGIDKYGVLHPSSRISNTQLSIYQQTENLLSALTSQEQTVLYSSGFLAGRAVIESLPKVAAYAGPGTHPAIQTNATILGASWQEQFTQVVNESNTDAFILLCDSVNPLLATVTDFSFLNNISPSKCITCVIDDSHGIGMLGDNGEGISSKLPRLTNVEYVISYSLSKAFHINGGAISCSSQFANVLRQSPFFTGSTSISPALCHAFVNGQQLYHSQRKKLQYNIQLMQELLQGVTTVTNNAELPILILNEIYTEDYFNKENVIISSFPYPDPNGKIINRIVINASHTKGDLEKIVQLLKVSR